MMTVFPDWPLECPVLQRRHPLAKGLVACIPRPKAGGLSNLVDGDRQPQSVKYFYSSAKKLYKNGDTNSSTADFKVYCNNGQRYPRTANAYESPQTIAFYGIPSGSGNRIFSIYDQEGGRLGFNRSGTYALNLGANKSGGNSGITTGSNAYNATYPCVVVGRRIITASSTSIFDIFVDGVNVANGTAAYVTQFTRASWVGHDGVYDGSDWPAGFADFRIGYAWTRALSDDEISLISSNPYLLITPSRRLYRDGASSSFAGYLNYYRRIRAS